jgi:hypothetical protein
LLFNINLFAATQILCKARYLYKVYHPATPPSYYEGKITGKIPIPGTGTDAYYEKKWSNNYTLNIMFFSGYELNELLNEDAFNDNSIIAAIEWNNGGYSTIIIKGYKTDLKSMTIKGIKYDKDGEIISKMTGYDEEGRFWEIYF